MYTYTYIQEGTSHGGVCYSKGGMDATNEIELRERAFVSLEKKKYINGENCINTEVSGQS